MSYSRVLPSANSPVDASTKTPAPTMINNLLVILPNQLLKCICRIKSRTSKAKLKVKEKRLSRNNGYLSIQQDDPDPRRLLDLPTEILILIFDKLLSVSKDQYDLARISSTSRQFRQLLLPYIYSECNILFEHSYNENSLGCIYRRDKFDFYQKNGHLVKKLIITTDQNMYHNSVPRLVQFQQNPPLPAVIEVLIPSFSRLTIAEFEGKVESRILEVMDAIELVITNCLSLKQLNIKTHTRRGKSPLSPSQVEKYLRSKAWSTIQDESYDEISDARPIAPATQYARLESLKIGIREYAPGSYWQSSSAASPEENEIPSTLEILSSVLYPTLETVKRFRFYQIPDPRQAHYEPESPRSENKYGPPRYLDLPNLESLDIQCSREILSPFDQYVRLNYAKVKELTIGLDIKSGIKLSQFLSRFTTLQFLHIDNLQPFATNPKQRLQVCLSRPWDYVRENMISPRIETLKLLSVANTLDHKEIIEIGLGDDVTRRCRVSSTYQGKRLLPGTKGKVKLYSVALKFSMIAI
ncbi:hypothetical protein H072_7729 [Dactylellina haptotyla CBS 200.50]|uniref:F-box domain-containing protein n=1 Tax=Dactylellina haptotyla (strain CBS 200.50) TaxID=1284197 RepID=S8BGR6_DACHA|nr:hypothetical protein H072_7729 [Dactylellina haptotyla CBS 200.50]